MNLKAWQLARMVTGGGCVLDGGKKSYFTL
jgi:hypothetical protein